MRLFAKKSLGQHFLNSTHVLEQIISAAQLKEGEVVLEIGPGTGVLTRALLAGGVNVVAVEKDVRAIELLKETFREEIAGKRLNLIEGDILEMTPEKLFSVINGTTLDSRPGTNLLIRLRGNDTKYSLIANIPYYITGAILEKFLEHGPRPDRMVLLVQKEVAERIVSRDGKESILSVSVKAFGTPKLVAKVPPGAFTPPPTVDSAILSVSTISDNLFKEKNVDISLFFKIVKAGFAHKRKFAIRNIEGGLAQQLGRTYGDSLRSDLGDIWTNVGLDPKVRAEDMTIGNWVEIASHLKNLEV